MTQEELRSAVRNLAHDYASEATSKFDASNYLLDYFIGAAYDHVMCDMAREAPHRILTYEDLTLTANTATTAPTKEWIQIWTINRAVSGQTNRPIPYIPWHDQMLAMYQGETKAEPDAWSIYQNSIYWLPTPSTTTAAYARMWIVPSEGSMPTAGPTYLPRIAHRLIPLQTMVLIAMMLKDAAAPWLTMYELLLKKISYSVGLPVQGQPRILSPAFSDKISLDDRDPALIDRYRFFER